MILPPKHTQSSIQLLVVSSLVCKSYPVIRLQIFLMVSCIVNTLYHNLISCVFMIHISNIVIKPVHHISQCPIADVAFFRPQNTVFIYRISVDVIAIIVYNTIGCCNRPPIVSRILPMSNRFGLVALVACVETGGTSTTGYI